MQSYLHRRISIVLVLCLGLCAAAPVFAEVTGPVVWGVQPATGLIIMVNPETGQLLGAFEPPGDRDLEPSHVMIGLSIAENDTVLIYHNSDELVPFGESRRLYRLNPFTGAVLSIETPTGLQQDGASYETDGVTDFVFQSHSGADVHRQIGYSGAFNPYWDCYLANLPGPVGGLGGDGHGREFGFFSDGFIHEYDAFYPPDNQFNSTLAPPATDIEGLAFDGNLLYAATASGLLFTLDPDSGEVVSSVSVPRGALVGLGAAIAVFPTIAVEIDVRPGTHLNPINPMSRGVIPVVVLGSDIFDIADVDAATLAFGPAAAPLAHGSGPHIKDANHDGIKDMLVHFLTAEAGIAFGDTETCVTGELLDGTPFEGCDTIRVVPSS